MQQKYYIKPIVPNKIFWWLNFTKDTERTYAIFVQVDNSYATKGILLLGSWKMARYIY